MEANTVILNLAEYNALRDFKKELEKGNTYRCLDYSQSSYYNGVLLPSATYISEEEAVKEIAVKNEHLLQEIADLQTEIQKLKNPPKTKEQSINDIKKMSVWEFRKWKRK
jgi:hypothetical protein